MIERIIILGQGSILKSCLKLASEAYNNAACEIYEPVKKAEMMEFLRGISEECLVISVMNPYIIAEDVVSKENLTIINVHHALLPRHPGLNAVAWTIWYGDSEGGITWHYVDSGVDSGEIILRKSIPLDDTMTSSKLMQKSKILMLDGLKEILPLENKKAGAEPAEFSEIDGESVHGPKDTINDGILDINWDMDKTSRFLRAMDFGFLHPLGVTKIIIEGKELEILSYTIRRSDDKENVRYTEYSDEKNTVNLFYENGAIELRVKPIAN